VLFAVLSPLIGNRNLSAEAEFNRVLLLFQHGELRASQEQAGNLARRFEGSSPNWTARFRILEAEAAAWRGMSPEVLRVLSLHFPSSTDTGIVIQRLSLMGLAHAHLHQFNEATQEFARAQALCSVKDERECGELLRARAGLAVELGQFQAAYQLYLQSLSSARRFKQSWDESAALMNLGAVSLREERFDEAIDWLRAATRIAVGLDARDILVNTAGNLGWAYYRLGDLEKALNLYEDAERRAVVLGDDDDAITWLTTLGNVYQDSHDLARAFESYRQALDLAKRINNKEEIVNSLEDLAHVSIEAGKLDEAATYIQQLDPLLRENANRLDMLDVMLAQGRIAAARRNDPQAETIFRTVEQDPASQVTMRLGAEHELARLFEAEGHSDYAEGMYAEALKTFESERAQLKDEDSKLPFLGNATRIYDDYIHLLVKQGKTNEALAFADQSRARTLAQGLGLETNNSSFKMATLHPGEIAQKAGATLLFYWLGEKQSYLWAISPTKTTLFSLPAQSEITPIVERYRKALLEPNDALESSNEDGVALYRILVAPARNLIRADLPVVILSDGTLSELNFETLIVSGPKPHYWIEDATLISAPSLYMLASAKPFRSTDHKLLLLGDAVSPNPDYPELPMAAFEMRQIQKHFAAEDQTVLARQMANSEAYLASAPQQFSYIHFVAHGVASRTDPLDSAIILSPTTAAEDSFKLYAREIIQHPIHARLVTISACYGSGTRSYAGEGLVGLSWAFLRAGAHNVIGALWEVSDDSTPRLMSTLYQGLEDGMPPSAALRKAKLTLLNSTGSYRKPFYWAPFQIYTGL
jgi:CHAT domain-containing protein